MEMAPSYSNSFGFSSLPQSVAVTHSIASSMNMGTSSSLRESPIPLQQPRRRNKEQRSIRDTTPTITQRSSGPPVRRVHPLGSSQDIDPDESSSSHESGSHDSTRSKQSATSDSVGATTATLNPTTSDNDVLPPSTTEELPRGDSVVTMYTCLMYSILFSDTEGMSEAMPVALGVGSKVIAKWKGKCWYLATITERGQKGRYVY